MHLNLDKMVERTVVRLERVGHAEPERLTRLIRLLNPPRPAKTPGFGRGGTTAITSLEPDISGFDLSSQGVEKILGLNDEQFVKAAYRVVLGREPDAEGYKHYLELLRAFGASKSNILLRFFRSAEGRSRGRPPVRLWLFAGWDFLRRIPVAGYLLDFLWSLARLPAIKQTLNRTDLHQYAQINRVEHVASQALFGAGEAHGMLDDHVEVLEKRMAVLEADERWADVEDRVAELQQQVDSLQQELARYRTVDYDPIVNESLRRLENKALDHSLAQGRATGEAGEYLTAYFDHHVDAFRGGFEDVKQRLEVYLPAVSSLPNPSCPVLDLASGRGEWLELLGDNGIPARGVELNEKLVARCLQRNLQVRHADLWDELDSIEDESVRAVTGFHIVEHLTLQQQLALMMQAHRILAPGGMLVLETPNPENLRVGSHYFYLDPTHANPIPKLLLKDMAEYSGFDPVETWGLNRPSDRAESEEAGQDPRIARTFDAPMDYAVLGYKEAR